MTTAEKDGSFFKKVNKYLPHDSAILPLGSCPEEKKVDVHMKTIYNIQSNFICNNKKEKNQMSSNEWLSG